MKKTSEVTACVVDHGRFVHVARTLGQSFGKVYYTTPEERDCPLSREACVGDGFDEIERVRDAWSVKDDCDLFVFPDVGFECLQSELKYQGFPVWGPGNASYLESHKELFLAALEETDLPMVPHETIKGLTNLRLHLMDQEDKWIKISRYRGDWETIHWTNWDEMEGTLDSYAVRFGCLKELIVFYVFDKIEAEVEDGIDAYFVNGQWPKTVLHGMECKDKAYIGTMQTMDDLPEEMTCVNRAMAPVLKRMCNTGAMKFSTEVRITKEGESFFIDPTCRFGSPPSQGECLLIKNLPEIIYRGALGELVEPETDGQFVVQALLTLCDDRDEWRSVNVTALQDSAIKSGFVCRVDGRLCFPPITEYHTKEAGYLCAVGNTLKDAIETLRGLKDGLPDGLKCEFDSIAGILKEIHEAEASGMTFTGDVVPEPETIISSSRPGVT